MDAEDRAVLTLLANCEAGLPQNTGSSVTMPVAENYQLSGQCFNCCINFKDE